MRKVAQAATGALVAACALTACSGDDSPAEQCESLIDEQYVPSDSARFSDVTYVEGDFVKGTVGEYVSGDARTVAHWECTTESGDPEITFYSPGD